jgi:hypothetical protein
MSYQFPHQTPRNAYHPNKRTIDVLVDLADPYPEAPYQAVVVPDQAAYLAYQYWAAGTAYLQEEEYHLEEESHRGAGTAYLAGRLGLEGMVAGMADRRVEETAFRGEVACHPLCSVSIYMIHQQSMGCLLPPGGGIPKGGGGMPRPPGPGNGNGGGNPCPAIGM